MYHTIQSHCKVNRVVIVHVVHTITVEEVFGTDVQLRVCVGVTFTFTQSHDFLVQIHVQEILNISSS
ncbi:hypothetical protein D3C75_1121590 [compost metagenome]